ncbi:MAG: hypothetical protein J6C13_04425 [Clostridia bacterium]|nr:hypothetical protein [Clostridia bacterium]
MKTFKHSKSISIVSILVLSLLIVALTASITLAAFTWSSNAKNTIYIADVGTITCTASAKAELYPGGTSTATISFNMGSISHKASQVTLSNIKLTKLTLTGTTFTNNHSTIVNTTANQCSVSTSAGSWVVKVLAGSTNITNNSSSVTWTTSSALAGSIEITVPYGASTGSAGTPANGYLTDSVTDVIMTFTVDVTATA